MIDFPRLFMEKMQKDQPRFEVRGILTADDKVYPLGTDSKVLSTIFELVVRPYVLGIAEENGLSLSEPDQQNYYPDFTLMSHREDQWKIAIDVKSTYRDFRKDGSWAANFTLGGYTSFLRSPSKNIAFPYNDYARHYIIGFIYTRRSVTFGHAYPVEMRESAICPFEDIEWFVQEKHRIAGERAGSGNTTNIGSITGSSVADFAEGNGPFAEAGEALFLDYWRNYGRTKDTRSYSNLAEYWQWKQTRA